MIANVVIENFKSIAKLELPLGRFNVLIGENGSGKSNVLEALAFLGAAAAQKLDNEFLASRGIRVADHKFMQSAFPTSSPSIRLRVTDSNGREAGFDILPGQGTPYPTWAAWPGVSQKVQVMFGARPLEGPLTASVQESVDAIAASIVKNSLASPIDKEIIRDFVASILKINHENSLAAGSFGLPQFIIFAPEVSALRTFEREGQILPLGIRGEGLFKLLGILAGSPVPDAWNELRDALRVLDWFEDIQVPPDSDTGARAVRLRDRFIPQELGYFDQRSANEAFLFLLFYVALFVSPDTPSCFAIDNLESALNPKLCRELVRRLVLLSKKYGKQVIVTTHHPAILDGLDLSDDDQRLFVVSRGRDGDTKVRRAPAPKPVGTEPPVRLSEAFLRGLLGGLPQNF